MSWSRRATVLGETAMPSLANSSAMVVVVRRDRAQAGHRIARGIVFEQAMENGDYVRRFFSSEYDHRRCGGFGRGPHSDPAVAVDRGPRYAPPNQGNRPAECHRHGPGEGTPARQTTAAVVRRASHKTKGWPP